LPGIEVGDESAPRFPIRKGDIPALFVMQILPEIMEQLEHYDADEIIHVTAGVFNGLSPIDVTSLEPKKAEAIQRIKAVLKTLEG